MADAAGAMKYGFAYNVRDRRVTINCQHGDIRAFTLDNVGPVVAWLLRELVRQANTAEIARV